MRYFTDEMSAYVVMCNDCNYAVCGKDKQAVLSRVLDIFKEEGRNIFTISKINLSLTNEGECFVLTRNGWPVQLVDNLVENCTTTYWICKKIIV